MTLTILGATGKTGVHLLARALDAGHHVRALVVVTGAGVRVKGDRPRA